MSNVKINIFGQQDSLNDDKFSPNWGFVVCHTEKDQGAIAWNGITEYAYCMSMNHRLPYVFSTRNFYGMDGASFLLQMNECNASIEPHFNAFNKRASGAMILVQEGDKLSAKYALEIIAHFKRAFPERHIRQGGILFVKEGDSGFANLRFAKKRGMLVALLSELFFGDTKADWLSPEKQAAFWFATMPKLV